jgi:nucleotide-binding universal stress UspA family protein
MKTVLLYVGNDDGFAARMQCALDITRANDGHLHCLQILQFGAYAAMDTYGGIALMADVISELEKIADETQSRVEADLANQGVSWSFTRSAMDASSAIIGASSLSDILVMSRPSNGKDNAAEMTIVGDAVMSCKIPVLVVPESKKSFDSTGTAMVAWNGSVEAAHALRNAVPLLTRASKVLIATIERTADMQRKDYFPSTAASEYLSRHGISSELITETANSGGVNEALGLLATGHGAEYLVMGAYGHSRAREYIFGGVTRAILKAMPLPLLLSH